VAQSTAHFLWHHISETVQDEMFFTILLGELVTLDSDAVFMH